MLVHICCSVDSHFFLQKLQQTYPNEPLVGFFYDPNIHPFSEYQLRLLDVRRSCHSLGIALYEGAYDYEAWIKAVEGLEEEPEKGKRCLVCFDERLIKSAQKAVELGEKTLTTTLLTSPKKAFNQLQEALENIANTYGLDVISPDFRKAGGTQEQFAIAKSAQLYHQDYCGCMFALKKQRDQQERWADELCSPLRPQILPSSIEERLALYEQVFAYEQANKPFKLRQEKFFNYRLLWAKVGLFDKVLPSYFLFYSTFKKERTKAKVAYIDHEKAYLTKETICLINIKTFNALAHTSYQNVKELLFSPPSIALEIALRRALSSSDLMSLTPIVVLDEIDEKGEYIFEICTKTYTDIREVLV